MDERVAGAAGVESDGGSGREQECPDRVGAAESGRGLWRQRELKRWAGAMEAIERDERRFQEETEARFSQAKA
jgi:hypothetical protein